MRGTAKLLTSCVALLGACGSDNSAASQTACTQLVTAFRAQVVACGRPPPEAVGSPDEVPSVERTCAALSAKVKSGILLFDPTKVAPCQSEFAALQCGEAIVQAAYATGFDATVSCAAVFAGTVSTGGACTGDEDCNAGRCNITRNNLNMAECPGKCVGATAAKGMPCTAGCQRGLICNGSLCSDQLLAIGEDCDSGPCVANAYCDIQGSLTCKQRVANGQPCDLFGDGCQMGHVCVNSVCVTQAANGATCAASGQFEPNPCQGGFCSNGTCVPYVPAKLGEPCGVFPDHFAYCKEDGACSSFSPPGVCQVQIAVGGDCTPGKSSNPCVPGAYCVQVSGSARACVQISECEGLAFGI